MRKNKLFEGLGSGSIRRSSFAIHRSRRAFTIVELLMVIGVIGILMGIVTSAAMGSLKTSRVQKADALCRIVEQGLATYYAQNDKWPEPMGSKIAEGIGARSNNEGYGNSSDDNIYILSHGEAQQMIRNIVEESARGNPMLDISALFVSRSSSDPQQEKCPNHAASSNQQRYFPAADAYGMDLFDAVRGTKRNPERMTLGQMNFGYPHKEHNGKFMPFRVVYSIPTDEMKVTKWHWCD